MERYNRRNRFGGTVRAFTLLELLAAIALLVILGGMLFEIFGSASRVVSVSNAKQEVFQYARAALEFIERELTGAFASVDANPAATDGIKGMRIFDDDSMGTHVKRRDDCQGIFLSTGVMARDVSGSPDETSSDYNRFYGHDVNCARIAYYLNSDPTDLSSEYYGKLQHSAIYRAEVYNLTDEYPGEGTPFVRNCLYFNILVMSRFADEDPHTFQPMDWISRDMVDVDIGTKTVQRRRGLPRALYMKMRMTDAVHARLYKWNDTTNKWYVPARGTDDGTDHWGEEDPVVQSFSQIVYFGRRSD